MDSVIEEFFSLMKRRENAHLEFKEAKNNYDSDKLTQYYCALANEGGGKMILGVADKMPRIIVGSQACRNLDKTKSDLITRLHLRIEAEELLIDDKRVVIFTIPPRLMGVPIKYEGIYWMRRGEELVAMTPDMLKRIFVERIGKGRSARYMLCKKYYALAGKGGTYTRKQGLDKETNKEFLLKHIKSNAKQGSKLAELT